MLADVIVEKNGAARFTWGRANLVEVGPTRDAYLGALHALDDDGNDIQPLLTFARSWYPLHDRKPTAPSYSPLHGRSLGKIQSCLPYTALR